MNSVIASDKTAQLPEPVARRGLDEPTWRTLVASIFPGAKSQSILMAVDYCKARGLDVMKRPCHIVPMSVKDADGNWAWRDVIMPGIYELRTTAARTGVYAGKSAPEWGPMTEFDAGNGHMIAAPEWCQITVFRLMPNGQTVGFTHMEFFEECVNRSKKGEINAIWQKRPRGMMAKATEAGALRQGFPEELQGIIAAEETSGYTEGGVVVESPTKRPQAGARGIKQMLGISEPIADVAIESEGSTAEEIDPDTGEVTAVTPTEPVVEPHQAQVPQEDRDQAVSEPMPEDMTGRVSRKRPASKRLDDIPF